ncbi:hypothetical protein [Bradyrhizobium aeschynomenes]|uniref:hypothetical protein n=1 Tax=Bradyrhizobium aeschynomenes TaxID=2734909 RepID=UPI00155684DF|nr:hypothetical protein [Bradyrhizobium aeschynomenes]NPV20369.1 hypothetical protein [Bradyrhizobium aeschynomenes]
MRSPGIAFLFALLLGSCSQILETGEFNTTQGIVPTPARYTWMLPKTVVSVTATYTLTECSDAPRKLVVTPNITLSNVSEPDIDLGPDFPNGMVGFQPTLLNSFWNDNNITVKTSASSHILSYLGAQPTNQTGSILSNLVASSTKLAAVAFGVPAASAPAAVQPFCGKAKAIIERIRELQAQLVDPASKPSETKDLPSQISTLQGALSISTTKKFDPGYQRTAISSDGLAAIGEMSPSLKDLRNSSWFVDGNAAQTAANSPQLRILVYLDFKRAFPTNTIQSVVQCNELGQHCSFLRAPVTTGTLFREVAYIPVLAFQASDMTSPVLKKTFPFGQFGLPRALPVQAGIFQSLTWSITFAESGEITEANFTSKATGLALTSLIQSAAGGANAIATERRAEVVAVDPETTRLQNVNSALKAQIDNLNYTKQLNELLARK